MYDFVITSGARPELFVKTIDSFMETCTELDLINKWICIDDGTSAEWRQKLVEKYPQFTWIHKTPEQTGHALSLNMLMPYLSTKYIIRFEDDFECIGGDGKFISQAAEILDENPDIGQVMFNRNYQEKPEPILLGGIPRKTRAGNPYLLHDWAQTEEEGIRWRERYGWGPSVLYSWPHFSLQPSLTRVKALTTTGKFMEGNSYFENEYGHRYSSLGWKTAFLPTVTCKHIGRLLNDYNGPLNAYEILGHAQFGVQPRQWIEGLTNYTY